MRIVYVHSDGQQMYVEAPDVPQVPLSGLAVVATLNAVLGVWSLQDAANIAQLPEQALIDEAQAWAAAQQPSA